MTSRDPSKPLSPAAHMMERVRQDAARGQEVRRFNGTIQQAAGGGDQFIWVKLTGATVISANQWSYAGTQMLRTDAGWAPATPTNAIAGILNSMEASNSAAGVQGNGVNHSGTAYPAGFHMQPASAGTPIVQVWLGMSTTGTPTYTCQVANAEDGSCT